MGVLGNLREKSNESDDCSYFGVCPICNGARDVGDGDERGQQEMAGHLQSLSSSTRVSPIVRGVTRVDLESRNEKCPVAAHPVALRFILSSDHSFFVLTFLLRVMSWPYDLLHFRSSLLGPKHVQTQTNLW